MHHIDDQTFHIKLVKDFATYIHTQALIFFVCVRACLPFIFAPHYYGIKLWINKRFICYFIAYAFVIRDMASKKVHCHMLEQPWYIDDQFRC